LGSLGLSCNIDFSVFLYKSQCISYRNVKFLSDALRYRNLVSNRYFTCTNYFEHISTKIRKISKIYKDYHHFIILVVRLPRVKER